MFPPKLNPAVKVPQPAKLYLTASSAPPDDQAVPLYSSVVATEASPVYPPKLNPAVKVPQPANERLAVAKSPPDDQAVPLYSSVVARA